DVVNLLRRLAEPQSAGPSQPLLARISGANIGLTVTSRGTTVNLDDLFFQVDTRSEKVAVSLRGKAEGTLASGFKFSSTLKAQGNVDRAFTASDATLHLYRFDSSLISTGAQTLQVVWNGNSVDVRKIQDRSPVEIEVIGDIAKREVKVDFAAEDLRIGRLFHLSGALARYASWMETPLTGNGHVSYSLQNGAMEYEARLSAYLEDQLPIHGVQVDTSFHGTEKAIVFEPLRLASADGNAEFSGDILFENLFPSGTLSLSDVAASPGQKVSATLAIQRGPGTLDVRGSRVSIGDTSFTDFHMGVTPLRGGASFTVATAFGDTELPNSLEASGQLRFGGALAGVKGLSLTEPVIEATATLKNVPPERVYRLSLGGAEPDREQAGILSLLAPFTVSSSLSLTTDFSLFSVESDSVVIARSDDPGTRISFGLSADSSRISLKRFSGTVKGLTVTGGFDGAFAPGGRITFNSTVSLLNATYALNGRYSPGTGLQASGAYGFSASVRPLPDGGVEAHLKAEGLPVPLASGPKPVSFELYGQMTRQGAWSVDFPAITVSDIPLLESQKNSLQVSGRLTPSRLDLRRISFADTVSTLTGSATADIVLPADIFVAHLERLLSVRGSATLASADGTETYSANGSLERGALTLDARFNGVPLSRIGRTSISGSLTGAVAVSGPLANPGIDVAATLKNGHLGTDPLTATAKAQVQPGVLRLRDVSFSYLGHVVTEGAGVIDLTKSAYAFNALYQGEYFADRVRLSAAIEGGYALPPPTGTAGLFDYGLQGKVSLSGITVAGSPVSSWGISYKTAGGRLTLDGGPGNSVHGWLDSQFAFQVKLADPLPLVGSAEGRIAGDRINASLTVDSFEVTVLNAMLKSPAIPTSSGPVRVIGFTSGLATGRITVDGAVNDPDFSGQIDVVGGGVQSAYSPDEAGPIRTTLVFEGRTFRMLPFTTNVGSAKMDVQASFTIDHWSPLAFDIAISTNGNIPPRARARFGRFIADGSVFGTARFAGDDRKTEVTGTVVASDFKLALGPAPQGKFEPEEVPTFVNVTVQTGRRVEFFWPSEDVPMLRTTASSGGKVAVTYRGDTGAYTVKGLTGIQGGEIYYFDRSFILKKGSITFNEDQNNFDPWLVANAEVREWDPQTGEEVKIYLDADSTLSKFSPRFTSNPGRSESEILAMIGAPILDRAQSEGLGVAALVYSDILSETWVLRPFEQKVRQILG
ncbi:MAG TPA: translocation/assembly module TamB domain-containing protein, partial [Spirochaetia bacterium]